MLPSQVFDKNRDGYIDEQELRETMQELGMILSADDIQAMMKKAGCKITGRIYYEGWLPPIGRFVGFLGQPMNVL